MVQTASWDLVLFWNGESENTKNMFWDANRDMIFSQWIAIQKLMTKISSTVQNISRNPISSRLEEFYFWPYFPLYRENFGFHTFRIISIN